MDANSNSQDSSTQNFGAFHGFSSTRIEKFNQLSNQLPFLKFQSIHSLVRPITPFPVNNNTSALVATPFEKQAPTLEPIFLPKGNSHVWVQPFGGIQRMNSYNGHTGMTSKNSGTAIGAGYNLTQKLTLGVLMGGTINSYTLDQNQGNGTANNYYAGIYGGYGGQEGLTVKGSLIFGQDRYTSQRNITALSLSAKNTHRGWNVSGRSEIGYKFRYGVNTLTPFVGVGLSKSYQNGYQETNAYPFNLNIPPTINKTLSTEIGIKFEKSIVINDALLKPLVGFSIIRDQPLQKQGNSVLSFADSSNIFAVPALNEIKTYAAATVGIASSLSDKITISSLVTGKIKHHERAVEAVVKFTYAF
jgi:outer membrane autotransporter protein